MLNPKIRAWPLDLNDTYCCTACDQNYGQRQGSVFQVTEHSKTVNIEEVSGLDREEYEKLLTSVSSFNKLIRIVARCKALFYNFAEGISPKSKFEASDLLFSFLTIIKTSQKIYGTDKEIKR